MQDTLQLNVEDTAPYFYDYMDKCKSLNKL